MAGFGPNDLRKTKGEEMTTGSYTRIALAGLLVSALFLCNSCVVIDVGDSAKAKCEKEVELAAPLAAGSSFSAGVSYTPWPRSSSRCSVLRGRPQSLE